MKTIVIADPLPEVFAQLVSDEFDLRYFDSANADDFQQARGIVVYGHRPIDAVLMDRCPNLKVISNHGVGVDHIDVAEARERGIVVGNTPGCLDASTADMTMALLLAVARNVVVGDQLSRDPSYIHFDPSQLVGKEVTGSTLGIVGMGRIGTEIARRAKAFDMRVLYHNRSRNNEAESSLGAEYRSLDDLLSESDFVSLNCPLSEATVGLIGAKELAKMKPTAILLNTARGPIVDTDALLDALQSKQILAAGLDVTEPEPLPRDHLLLSLSNVTITPHLGSASDLTRRKMMEMTIANLRAGLREKLAREQLAEKF